MGDRPYRGAPNLAAGDVLAREAQTIVDREARIAKLEEALALGTSDDADAHWRCARAAADLLNASGHSDLRGWDPCARRHVCACLDLEPARVEALVLASNFASRQELRAALLTRALELDPRHATARYERAWAFRNLGLVRASREDFTAASGLGGYEGWGDAAEEARKLADVSDAPGEEGADATGARLVREETARREGASLWSALRPPPTPPVSGWRLARDLGVLGMGLAGLAALWRAC